MIDHFNELLRVTPDEGASATIGLSPTYSADGIDDLLEAWYRERQERTEAALFLDEVQRLLKRIIREGRITPAIERKATNLLLAIRAVNQSS
jgi:hypothetical protein